MHLQIIFLDYQPGPDNLEQLILVHHPITVLDQYQQQIERARAEPGWLAVNEHLACLTPDGTAVEYEIGSDGRVGHWHFSEVSGASYNEDSEQLRSHPKT